MATRLKIPSDPDSPYSRQEEAARAYDAVGDDYLRYADGDATRLFEFTSRYSFADREIWTRLDAALVDLRTRGRQSLRIVDAGCGPGTWLVRLVLRARALGFTDITARGFDISPEMIVLAHAAAADVTDEHICITFDVGDITAALDAEQDESSDITLCLYGVLNHLPVETLDGVAVKLARITRGSLFVTVRTVGSLPTIYVKPLEDARAFHQDNDCDRLEVDLADGRHIGFGSHLFCATELRALFRFHTEVTELVGLDLFHGRFARNPHWNPRDIPGAGFEAGLERLEHLCACDPAFIDRAAHILLIANAPQ